MENRLQVALRWFVFALVLWQVEAFYVPTAAYRVYDPKQPIPVLFNKVYSDNTQLQYAYADLPFVCKPSGKTKLGELISGQKIALNLGEILRGDRIMVSDVELAMQEDKPCNFLCTAEVSRKDVKRARQMVRDGYLVEWIVDNLPGATSFVTVDRSRKYYAAGFKLGYTDLTTGRPKYYLNNHHTIVIRYRRARGANGDAGRQAIVGFEVYPKSIGLDTARGDQMCPKDMKSIENGLELHIPVSSPNQTNNQKRNVRDIEIQDPEPDPSIPAAKDPNMVLLNEEPEPDVDDGATLKITYTYSVFFRQDTSVDWKHRWDLYFVNQQEGSRVHWLAVGNSLIICSLLTGIVLMILARTVWSDISKGKDRTGGEKGSSGGRKKKPGLLDQGDDQLDDYMSSEDEALEDVSGWKLLHGDVFRTPIRGYLLAPMVGSGMQLLFMAVGLVLLSAFGVLNPSFRGGFISFGVGLFVFAGIFSGYYSARVYKMFGGKNWRANVVVTAILFPGLLFGFLFILNLFIWANASSTAIPFTTLLAIVALWLCIQLPLVYIGSWFGFTRRPAWEHPTKTTNIPRQIPQQAWYLKGLRTVLLAGLIPFAVIFIELLFIFQSMWQDKSGFYYVFGFSAVIGLLLVLSVAEVTVVAVYIQLCAENHDWWWQSFMVGGGSAVWVFAYCVWYYFMKLHITGFFNSLLFFTYSFIACGVYGLLTGTVGFLMAYAFVRRIYAAIKVE
ncbi:Endomembrane protein 70 domain containing protein [Rhypophila sp. PSN 637]